MDDNYSAYLRRIMRSTLPDTYESQVRNVQSSGKFEQTDSGTWMPTAFPGYTIVTPTGREDSANESLYERLASFQQQLLGALSSQIFIPVPPSSFHLTVADLIWSDAFDDALKADPDFEQKLCLSVKESFEQSSHLRTSQPISFRVVGLMVMTRSLTLALAATDEAGYNQILELRRSIYQSPRLMSIGIEQQYHFTPHITLGYFGDLSAIDRSALAIQIDELNQPWLGSEETFSLKTAQLRQFPDMSSYKRSDDWASFTF